MGIVIDLIRRVIELDDGPQLHFQNDDSFFYLNVIALVAQKQKDRYEEGSASSFVSLGEIEEQAWACSKQKPRAFKDRKSMRTMIYQTWRNRLKASQERCVYEVIWPEFEKRTFHHKSRLDGLFEVEVGRGPDRAAFRISYNPESIEIIAQNNSSHFSNKSNLTTLKLGGKSDKQKVQLLIDMLRNAVRPDTYKNTVSSSYNAITSLLVREDMRSLDEKGMLKLSVREYADAYMELIFGSGVYGGSLLISWLEKLVEDPWWQELISPGNKTPVLFNRIPEEPITKTMCRNSHQLGDIFSLLWLFHRAYISSAIAANRDSFISTLQNQNQDVQKEVYKAWCKFFHSNDYTRVMSDPIKAFKDLQKISLATLPYTK